jgi:NAD(P)-dependent dehydrogenase (short-subunit alcohol dehydrogenase family)
VSVELEGRVAIVTGGARGLGRAYCVALAEAGAAVVVADVLDGEPVAREIEGRGGAAIAVATDVADEQSTRAVAAAALSSYGRIDVLVNNAAMFSDTTRGPFEEITVDEWDRCFAVNVRGAWLCARAVVPAMRERRYGKIVNVSSNTIYKGTIGFLHYVSSKAALVGMTRALARELGDAGIRVNTVSPDLVPNPELRPTDAQADEVAVAARCLKRTMTPDDMVGSIVYFSSPASDFVTGQHLLVNGGIHFH